MINDVKNLPVFPGRLSAFGEQHIQTPCVTLFFSRALEIFSWEMHVFISCKSCYTISRGSWPLLISLSGSKDTHRGWGYEAEIFLGISCFMSLLYLLRTLWDLCEDQIFQEKGFVNPNHYSASGIGTCASSAGKWWWNEVIKGVDLNLTACVWILVSFLWTIVFLWKLLNLSDSMSSFVNGDNNCNYFPHALGQS